MASHDFVADIMKLAAIHPNAQGGFEMVVLDGERPFLDGVDGSEVIVNLSEEKLVCTK